MTTDPRTSPPPAAEKTARHCGHLDILRELLDGTTGQ
ncbi:mycothiol transferase [Arthrobacter sp. MDT2-16]